MVKKVVPKNPQCICGWQAVNTFFIAKTLC